MVLMKMSVGWSCPSPPQRKMMILKGKETACRHAYKHKQDKMKQMRPFKVIHQEMLTFTQFPDLYPTNITYKDEILAFFLCVIFHSYHVSNDNVSQTLQTFL